WWLGSFWRKITAPCSKCKRSANDISFARAEGLRLCRKPLCKMFSSSVATGVPPRRESPNRAGVSPKRKRCHLLCLRTFADYAVIGLTPRRDWHKMGLLQRDGQLMPIMPMNIAALARGAPLQGAV